MSELNESVREKKRRLEDRYQKERSKWMDRIKEHELDSVKLKHDLQSSIAACESRQSEIDDLKAEIRQLIQVIDEERKMV